MSKQTQSSMALVGVIAGGVGFLAFLVLLVIGNFGFNQALFLALGLALVVAVFLFVAFHRPPEAPAMASAPSAQRAPSPAPAAATPAPEPAPAPAAAPEPAAVEESPVEAQAGPAARPEALEGPREGGPDDLKKIKGVGPKLENMLHGMGFYHFDQIAAWTSAEVAWVDENLEGFKGRVSRDDWVEQAKLLASGGETEFSKKVEGGDVY